MKIKKIKPNLVSIIVPAHNEEELITKFVDQVVRECQKLNLNYEMIIIENGSNDNTWSLLVKKFKKNNRIKLIKLASAGYGLALIKGIAQANGSYLVIFNVDYWDKRFLALTKKNLLGYDIISGSKLLTGSEDGRSFDRRVITWILNKILNRVFDYKGSDTHGLKAIRASMIYPVVNSCVTTSGIFDTEMMIKAQRAKLAILEIPVKVKDVRPARFGKKRFLQTFKDLYSLWKVL